MLLANPRNSLLRVAQAYHPNDAERKKETKAFVAAEGCVTTLIIDDLPKRKNIWVKLTKLKFAKRSNLGWKVFIFLVPLGKDKIGVSELKSDAELLPGETYSGAAVYLLG